MSSLTFCHSLGGQPGQILHEIVQEYNAGHRPTVELQSINPQVYASAAKEALSKVPKERPHFILAPEYMTGTMQKALTDRVLLSVKSLLDQERINDIVEFVKKTFGVDCLPFNPACGVLYMNNTMLQKAGCDATWKPKSFEELIEACEQLKEKVGVASGFTCAWPEAYLVEVVLAQKNLPLVDAEGKYNFKQLKEHILHIRQLVQEGVFLPPQTGNYDKTRDAFIRGEVPFYMQGSGHSIIIEQEAKQAGFVVGYAPLPTLSKDQKVKYAFPLGGAAIWVCNTEGEKNNNASNQDSDPEVAPGVREFLNYFASKETQAKWHVRTAYVPVSKSIRDSLKDFHKDHPLHEAVISQTIEAPFGENSFGIKKENYHLVRPQLYPLIRDLFYLQGNVEQVEQEVEKRLSQFERDCNNPKS